MAADLGITPIVDLDTGGVIALQAAGNGHGNISAVIQTIHNVTGSDALLPLVLPVPAIVVIGGSAAMAPLHEALRISGRRPGEIIIMVRGDFAQHDRRALLIGLDGLRAIGYLIAVGDLGAGHIPLDLLVDAGPYLAVISPELISRTPRDARRSALAESLAALARGVGAHVLAPGVSDEAQLTAVRGWGVRLAQGPLLVPGPSGRVHVPIPVVEQEPVQALLGPRVQEFLLPAVTLPYAATAEDAAEAFGSEPSITSVILVDEYQRPGAASTAAASCCRSPPASATPCTARSPPARLADTARTVPKTTPAIAAMQLAGRDTARVYDDLVVTDEVGRCMGVVRVADLIRQVAAMQH